MSTPSPQRGDVVLVCLDTTVGSEIRKTRPCVIISNDVANEVSPQVTVVPATEYDPHKARFPVCVVVSKGEGGLREDSILLCSQIRTVDKKRVVGAALGRLFPITIKRLDQAITLHLALT